MPQGRLKVKAKVPTVSKKPKTKANNKGGLGLKKGSKYIAPKKRKLKQAEKVRKGLENAIKDKIEQELQERATKEGKPFKVVGKAIRRNKQKKKGSKSKK